MPASLAAPSVATLYDAHLDLADTVTIGVSQSGSTQEIVEALDWAKACGSATIAVTNVDGSPLAQTADIALLTRAGYGTIYQISCRDRNRIAIQGDVLGAAAIAARLLNAPSRSTRGAPSLMARR